MSSSPPSFTLILQLTTYLFELNSTNHQSLKCVCHQIYPQGKRKLSNSMASLPSVTPNTSEQLAEGSVRRVLNKEYLTTTDGRQYIRKINPDGTSSAWEAIAPPPPSTEDEQPPVFLHLVLENQAEGEPKHWYLFVAPEGKAGSVYQVTGDATFMHYEVQHDSSRLTSESYDTSYILARLDEGQENVVRSCAESEAPPRAENRASVTENCQGWTIRVLRRLQQEDIVPVKWISFAEGIKQPV